MTTSLSAMRSIRVYPSCRYINEKRATVTGRPSRYLTLLVAPLFLDPFHRLDHVFFVTEGAEAEVAFAAGAEA